MKSLDDIRRRLEEIQKEIDDFGDADDCDRREDLGRHFSAKYTLEWVLQLDDS